MACACSSAAAWASASRLLCQSGQLPQQFANKGQNKPCQKSFGGQHIPTKMDDTAAMHKPGKAPVAADSAVSVDNSVTAAVAGAGALPLRPSLPVTGSTAGDAKDVLVSAAGCSPAVDDAAGSAAAGDLVGSALVLRSSSPLEKACADGDTAAICRLLDEGVDPSANKHAAFRAAAKGGHVAVVERLLLDRRVNPGVYSNVALQDAAEHGHTVVCEKLLADPRVNPAADHNRLIQWASANGHLAFVELLLADPRVDPSDFAEGGTAWVFYKEESVPPGARVDPPCDFFRDRFFVYRSYNHAICMAARNGHTAVVERLLAHPKVDPSAGHNYALRAAAAYGHVATVKRLLGDPRVDPSDHMKNDYDFDILPSDDCSTAVLAAAHSRSAAVMRLVLAHPRAAPAAWNNAALRIAAAHRSLDVAHALLDHPDVDPADFGHEPFLALAVVGDASILKRLLADPRVDPAVHGNHALLKAVLNCNVEAVECLLADPRVDPAAADNDLVRTAAGAGKLHMLCDALSAAKLRAFHARLQEDTLDELPGGLPAALLDGDVQSARGVLEWAAERNEPIALTEEEMAALEAALADAEAGTADDLELIRLLGSDAGRVALASWLAGAPHVWALDITDCLRKQADCNTVLRLLLADPRVDPSAHDNAAIKAAASWGDVTAVELLLAHPKVDPAADDHYAFRLSSKFGFTAIVDRLLADPRVDAVAARAAAAAKPL